MQNSAMASFANEHIRLTVNAEGTAYDIAVQTRNGWQSLGQGIFGKLVVQTSNDQRQETPVRITSVASSDNQLSLSGEWTDSDGVVWTMLEQFELTDDPHQIRVIAQATPSANAKVMHFTGPTILGGEGTFGGQKTDALFPGLEYLGENEPSSSTAFASSKYAGRSVPHPYKIAVPMMAVSHAGFCVGLIWDPNQDYGSAWRHPGAVFSSPNQLDGTDNHLMGLFAPGVPRFVDENSTNREAARPLGAKPNQPIRLEAQLVALTEATSIDVLKAWVAAYGLPTLEPPHDFRQNVDLCVRSYLDIAWDDDAEGWHHTLADPWGPRYEQRLIAQLWRYSQWPEGNPALRARARDQVQRGLARAIATGGGPENPSYRAPAPHLDLALHFGHLARSLTSTKEQIDALISSQDANGSWLWKPNLIAHPTLATEERKKALGGEDSATGLTAERATHLLTWARITGDAAAREAGLRAVAWCNAQTRPEGAQTWELHLHVPDVLAAPYLIDINLEAYHFTGNKDYLDQAERWAWTGLPFTYLWSAYYRPIMAYCTVPVFGVTFHDLQSWFGVNVQWNGLVYADALFRLADAVDGDRWRQVALGITICGIQQQRLDGPWMGMYPDAVSVVRGDEEYTWWLNPNLIGLNTFELAGIPLDTITYAIEQHNDTQTRVTSSASVERATTTENGLHLHLNYPAGEAIHTIVGRGAKPSAVRTGGAELSEVDDLDQTDQGWQWLSQLNVLLVKQVNPIGTEELTIVS